MTIGNAPLYAILPDPAYTTGTGSEPEPPPDDGWNDSTRWTLTDLDPEPPCPDTVIDAD